MSVSGRLTRTAARALMELGAGRVAAFHVTRCGSRVLGDLLAQHPGVLWDAEIFAPPRIALLPALLRPTLEREPLRHLDLRTLRAGLRLFGHETTLNQIDEIGMTPPRYLEALERRGFNRFVRLERDNLLRVIVSHVSARERSQWHSNASEHPRLHPVTIDVEHCHFRRHTKPLIEHLEDESASQSALNRMLEQRRTLWLTYERDIADDPTVGYRRVCEFVGLEPTDVTVRYSRTHPFALDQLLANFDAVAAALRGSDFEWMLDA